MTYMDMMYAQGGHGAFTGNPHHNVISRDVSERLFVVAGVGGYAAPWTGGRPKDDPGQEERELRYQIRRQSHHPSIIGWNGCNECEQTPAVVMATVAEEDNSRVIRGKYTRANPPPPPTTWFTGISLTVGLPWQAPALSVSTHLGFTRLQVCRTVNPSAGSRTGARRPATTTRCGAIRRVATPSCPGKVALSNTAPTTTATAACGGKKQERLYRSSMHEAVC